MGMSVVDGSSSYDAAVNVKESEIDLGTTIIAVTFDGGVVLGADSRTSVGGVYVSNRVSDKITPVADNICCCRSGSAADTQAIADIVRTQLAQHSIEIGRSPAVKTAATLFERYLYEYKEQLTGSIICAGYDSIEGGTVYVVPLGGGLHKQPYVIGGSGSTYIYGFCDANWREGMNREEARKFVKMACAHAMARDGSSGGVIRTCVIDKNGVDRDFTPGDSLPFNL